MKPLLRYKSASKKQIKIKSLTESEKEKLIGIAYKVSTIQTMNRTSFVLCYLDELFDKNRSDEFKKALNFINNNKGCKSYDLRNKMVISN